MTRKHFAAIAQVIAEHRWIAADQRDLDLIAYGLAEVCADANPRFDRTRFLAACGVEPNPYPAGSDELWYGLNDGWVS